MVYSHTSDSGSGVEEHLQDGAMAIFEFCFSHNIWLEIDWLPHADAISRIVDYDDWSLNKTVFGFLDANWGPHTVDCFVSPHNKQVERFTWMRGRVRVRMK